MVRYLALMGHQPHITRAELAALLDDFKPVKTIDKIHFFFETAHELDQNFLNRLGGTVLISKQIDIEDPSVDKIPELMYQELRHAKGKAAFAVRFINVGSNECKDVYRKTKNALKSHGITSRYIGNERMAAVPVQLHDQGLLDPKNGAELVVVKDGKTYWIGKTIAAHDIKSYAKRDMQKPVRDTTVGLLPPKLAQTLINFGEWMVLDAKQTMPARLTVFDPFCGTGVIPMECLLRGHEVLASDSSQKAVNGCDKNLEWSRKEWKIGKREVSSTVWKQDAVKPFKLAQIPDVIVTETTLGPALTTRPTQKDMERMRREVEAIEIGFIENAKATLPGVPIVATWPVWFGKSEPVKLGKILKTVEQLGYRFRLPAHTEPSFNDRLSMLYRRPDQWVGREIVLLEAH